MTDDMTNHATVTMSLCPVCAETVPAAPFCGHCGADHAAPPGPLRRLLRPSAYVAAHREAVWTPRLSSTALPRLPGAMRWPYRAALTTILIAMIVFSLARMPGPLAVTGILGWPLVFAIYLSQTDVANDLPRRILLTSVVLGVALGMGWWLLAGARLADSYGVSTGSALMLRRVVDAGLLMTGGGAVLMLVPAVITRFLRTPVRESLDGFVVGASGALAYLVAAEITTVGPQLVEGLVDGYSSGRLLESALTHGIGSPIAATAAGGLLGMRLWFTSPDRRAGLGLTLCTIIAVPLYLLLWVIDAMNLPRLVEGVVTLGLVTLALGLIRCGVQIALLHERPDPASGEPVLCAHCERVVPDLPFCSACGVAARASSRSWRQRRRENPPIREIARQES